MRHSCLLTCSKTPQWGHVKRLVADSQIAGTLSERTHDEAAGSNVWTRQWCYCPNRQTFAEWPRGLRLACLEVGRYAREQTHGSLSLRYFMLEAWRNVIAAVI